MLGTASTARVSRKRSWPTTNTSIEPAHCANLFHCSAPRPDCSERGVFGWRMRYRRLTKQGRSSKGASPGRIFGLGNRACRVYQVKDRLRCSIGQYPTELDAMWTPQSDGKREWLCFIERKDKSFVSNYSSFLRENLLIFRFCERKTKNTGTFFRPAPCFSHRSPSFSGRPPAPERNR